VWGSVSSEGVMRIKKNIQAKEKKSNIPLPNKNINISENQNIFMSDLILLHALPENNIMIKMDL
jgi:uncharacterized protein YllA (UPF0747 family)